MTNLSIHTQLINMQEKLYCFALSMTEDKEDARDLLQETILRVLDNQEKFAIDSNFKAWVFTMMRNIFINNYRKSVREKAYVSTKEDVYKSQFVQIHRRNSPESECSLHEIQKVMQNLDEDIRLPFSMHVMGFKYHEIAEEIGIPIGTVKSRIHVARKKLMQQLQGY